MKKKQVTFFLLVRFLIDDSVAVDFDKIFTKILEGYTRTPGDRNRPSIFYRIRQFFRLQALSPDWKSHLRGRNTTGWVETDRLHPHDVENKITHISTSNPQPTFKMGIIFKHLG